MPTTTTSACSNELQAARTALGRQIARRTAATPVLDSAVPGLKLFRFDAPTEPVSVLQDASICLIAQGAKRVFLGDEEYVYDAHHFLVTSVGLPVMAQIIEATPDVPYLGLKLLLDQRELARLLVDANMPQTGARQAGRGMAVGELEEPLVCAFQRLLDLLDEPEGIPILAPLIQREILYRLLLSNQGPRLRQLATVGSHSHQIARSLDWIRENFAQPLRVDDLASSAGMSASTFHHHFRSVTAMSPLQFQKWMRLHEARRLMLTERQDATSAAFQVGYESPSQFSREYSRLFGAPPLRDIRRLHGAVGSPAM